MEGSGQAGIGKVWDFLFFWTFGMVQLGMVRLGMVRLGRVPSGMVRFGVFTILHKTFD